MNWVNIALSEDSYYQESIPKDTIYIRNTQGFYRPDWVINSWSKDRSNSTNKIRSGSAFVIGGSNQEISSDNSFNGSIYRSFDPQMWAHHLFIKSKNNTFLNQKSIGIEICNYGELVKSKDGNFYSKTNVKIRKDDVTVLEAPFRGEKYFHSYSPEQLKSLKELLISLSNQFDIDLKRGLQRELLNGDENHAFSINENALRGLPGIWSHSNVRIDKLGCYPHPDLINLIKAL